MANETLKDKELQQHYDALFTLFASPGCRLFLAQAHAHADGISDIRNLGDKPVEYRLGQLDVYDWVLAYQNLNEGNYQILLLDDNPSLRDGLSEEGYDD